MQDKIQMWAEMINNDFLWALSMKILDSKLKEGTTMKLRPFSYFIVPFDIEMYVKSDKTKERHI